MDGGELEGVSVEVTASILGRAQDVVLSERPRGRDGLGAMDIGARARKSCQAGAEEEECREEAHLRERTSND